MRRATTRWTPTFVTARVLPHNSTLHRFFASTSYLNYGGQLPAIRGSGQGYPRVKFGHRWPELCERGYHAGKNRLTRAVSAFNPSTRFWISVPSNHPSTIHSASMLSSRTKSPVTPSLSLVSWNVDALSLRNVTRSRFILKQILDAPKAPDIIFLQEVSPKARDSILEDARVRKDFLVTDAEDYASFEGVPFTTMTLLSKKLFRSGLFLQERGDMVEGGGEFEEDPKFVLGPVSRIALPSMYGRDALCVDIIPPNSPTSALRLVNVHLDSLQDGFSNRAKQLQILANALREPECGGGLIAGDFNAISPDDHGLIDKNGLEDAWFASGGGAGADGATWNVDIKRQDRLKPGRLDKVAMVGLRVTEMEILRPGLIDIPVPAKQSYKIPWSDHCGLRCTFTF